MPWTPAAPLLEDPLPPDPVLQVALLLVVALLAAGAAQRWLRLPAAVGPMLVGALAGPAGLGWIAAGDLLPWQPLIDLAIGLMLFELGARVRPRWLFDNPWLGLQSVAQALGVGLAVSLALVGLGAPSASALLAGAVAMSTSPVLTLAGVHALNARGQVAERVLLLSACNSICAVLALKAWSVLAWVSAPAGGGWVTAGVSALHALVGSMLLGAVAGWLLQRLSAVAPGGTGRGVLQLALVVVAAMLAARWALSPLLALLVAGVVARERMGHGLAVESQFGAAGLALQLLLFLALGLLSTPLGDWQTLPWALAIVVARGLGHGAVLAVLARPSGLGWRQAAGLWLALQPAAGLMVLSVGSGTLGAGFGWPVTWPTPDPHVFQALLMAVTWLQLIGAWAADVGLRRVAAEGEGTEPA